MIIIFAMKLLDGGLYDMSIIMIKIMSLFIVLGYYLVSNVNLILIWVFFVILFF